MSFTKIYSFFTEDKLQDEKDIPTLIRNTSKLLRVNHPEIVKLTKFKNTKNNNLEIPQYCVSIILNKDITNDKFNQIIEDTNTLLGVPSTYQYYYYKNNKEPPDVKYTYTNRPEKPENPEKPDKPKKMEFIQEDE